MPVKQKSPILRVAEGMRLYFFVVLGHLILLFEVQKQTKINLKQHILYEPQ